MESPTYQTYGDPPKNKKEENKAGTKIATRRKGEGCTYSHRGSPCGLEDRRAKQEVSNITQDESVDEEDMVDDEGVQDEREIWEVTHVSEQES